MLNLYRNYRRINKLQVNFKSFFNTNNPLCHANVTYGSDDHDANEFVQKSDKYINFDTVYQQRRAEAGKSVLVQVNSEKSFPELHTYCSQFGQIKESHHYKNKDDESHFVLVQFSDEVEAKELLKSCVYQDDTAGVQVQSQFVWFRAGPKLKLPLPKEQINVHLKSVDATRPIPDEELRQWLQVGESVDDQIQILLNSTCLNEVGIRLRFLAAMQVERSVSGMFPDAVALPFGSSVNGFGKQGCDLDLILRVHAENHKDDPRSRLVFHAKSNLNNSRSQIQRHMECIGDILHLFLPGCGHVRRILQARVPIIKYHHEHLDLEVDLSMSNLTGMYMSEMLYMMGQLDARVRALTFTIRKWAQTVGLTNPSPGRWISNFSLSMLVLFFLQQLKNPVLPPINAFVEAATKDDVRITEDQINCTFLRDLNQLKFQTTNTDSLSALLLKFFEFYSQFDFNFRAISLNEGKSVMKPDHSAMFIVNPFEKQLNVSKNVSLEETDRFRIEVRNAAWILESKTEHSSKEPWGLLALFKTPQQSVIRPQMFFKPRMVDISELMHDKDASLGVISDSGVGRPAKLAFKNTAVKQQIEHIQRTSKTELNKMKHSVAGHKQTRIPRR